MSSVRLPTERTRQVNDGLHDAASNALNIIIVGAGIGGLMAAIALRSQGHRITILEQSEFANEAGAAIHLAPNANGILRRFGLYADKFGGNECLGITDYTPSGHIRFSVDGTRTRGLWEHPWELVHRVHLHNTLKTHASRSKDPGEPAILRLGCRVMNVDPSKGSVTLKSGEELQADLIIGADGVGSKCRAFVEGGQIKPFDSGKSAFRFLIEKDKVMADPGLRQYVEKDGILIMFIGNDRRLVMYPCSHNTLLNFVAIHPSTESEATGNDWNEGGSKATLLKVYKDFCPDVLKILSLVDPSTLKVWALLDMPVIPTWINQKLALLGDAAHPFLPHQGQGGGQAIEDAASIAALLPAGTKPEEVPDRLRLYEQCRKVRADRIQEYTRLAGRDLDEAEKSGKKLDMMEYTIYNFGHDEWHASTRALAKHLATQQTAYLRAPISFGPFPGPRQTVSGHPHALEHAKERKISIRFRTSRTLLDNFLPSGFSFVARTTVAEATWACSTLSDLDWLGGGGYNHLGLYLHGVCYMKKDGSKIFGTFLVVLFEDLADPIISGREELGFPKLPCSIEVEQQGGYPVVKAAWRGLKFLEMGVSGLQKQTQQTNGTAPSAPAPAPAPASGPPATNGAPAAGGAPGAGARGPPPPPPDNGLMYHRYIPAVGRPGHADADYPVFCAYSTASVERKVEEESVASTAQISYNKGDANSLPTLHHITKQLAEIPFLGLVKATVVESSGVDDVRGATRIE